ncbi:MAG: DUF86 domain-containing protein [Christensenellaceae bacterium]|jgi:uncharacterized protein with HEPN domain|nr:DUF86 domain-containing protein [Christensenellaceae bacterium]
MSGRDRTILEKTLKEINCLNTLLKGVKTFEDFDADEKTKRSVVMTLINVGELVKHLSDDFKESHNNIPFHAITALRNVATHGYLTLNFKIIWNTVNKSIPELKTQIADLLK